MLICNDCHAKQYPSCPFKHGENNVATCLSCQVCGKPSPLVQATDCPEADATQRAMMAGALLGQRGVAMGERVNHPLHYGGDTTYEVIKVLEAWGLDKDFCLGNTVKYIARAGKKDDAKVVEDLKKARWYLDRRIQKLEEGA